MPVDRSALGVDRICPIEPMGINGPNLIDEAEWIKLRTSACWYAPTGLQPLVREDRWEWDKSECGGSIGWRRAAEPHQTDHDLRQGGPYVTQSAGVWRMRYVRATRVKAYKPASG